MDKLKLNHFLQYMKHFKIILFILITYSVSAQKVVGLGGVGLYLNTTFDNSSYFSANLGLEYNITNYLKPEVRVEYFLGSLPEIETFNQEFVKTEIFSRSISAVTVGISPKINHSRKEETIQFQIIPMYNFTTIFTDATILTLDSQPDIFRKSKGESIRETQHSVGIGVGVLLKIDSATYQAIAFELNYNNIDLGTAFTKIDFNRDSFHTNQSFGIRVKYYFGFASAERR